MKLKRSQIAAIKRVAMTVQPSLKKKDKLNQQIAKIQQEIAGIDEDIHVWEQGIRNLTGFGIEELVEREVVNGQTRFIVKEDILEEDDETVAEPEQGTIFTPVIENEQEQEEQEEETEEEPTEQPAPVESSVLEDLF